MRVLSKKVYFNYPVSISKTNCLILVLYLSSRKKLAPTRQRPFELCYSKCRCSTDRIKQRSRVYCLLFNPWLTSKKFVNQLLNYLFVIQAMNWKTDHLVYGHLGFSSSCGFNNKLLVSYSGHRLCDQWHK